MRTGRTVLDAVDQPDDAAGLSLADRAFRQLEELIVTLRLAPGELLAEQVLAKQLKIGRTPVREALQRLAREGLVEIMPRRGTRVSEINVRNQLELLRVRRILERLMAHLAAARATAADRAAFDDLARAIDRAVEQDDDVGFMRLDHRLNTMVPLTCRNEYAQIAMNPMHALSRRFWYMHYKETLDLPLCGKLHADIARAIAAGDPTRAAKASDALVDYVEDFTLATLEADQPAERVSVQSPRRAGT